MNPNNVQTVFPASLQTALNANDQPFLSLVASWWNRHPDPGSIQAAALLATVAPFDPNARIGNLPLLTVLMGYNRSNDLGPLATGVEELKQNPEAWNLEWLAAQVLAAGADAWTPHPISGAADAPTADALDHALVHGMTGLAERLLDTPGAPAAAERAAAAVPFHNPQTPSNWWHILCAHNHRTPVLRLLAARGADPHIPLKGHHPLAFASRTTVDLYAEHGWIQAINVETRDRIQKTWKTRTAGTGSERLSLQDFEAMGTALNGSAVHSEQQRNEALITQLLAVPLGGQFSHSNSEAGGSDLKQAAALSRLQITRGPHAGQWSWVSAKAYSLLRLASGYSEVQRWPLTPGYGACFEHQYSEPGQPAVWANWVKKSGVLAETVGFDWQPGIPAAAIVALSVAAHEDVEFRDCQKLFDLLGVGNPLEWMRKLLPAAVRFTEALTQNGRSLQFSINMLFHWHKVLDRHGLPHQWEGKDSGWEWSQRLLQALSSGYQTRRTQNQNRIPLSESKSVEWLAQRLAEPTPPEGAAGAIHAALCLEVAFLSADNPVLFERFVQQALAHPAAGNPQTSAAWHEAIQKTLERRLAAPSWPLDLGVQQRIQHALFDAHTPDAPARRRARM